MVMAVLLRNGKGNKSVAPASPSLLPFDYAQGSAGGAFGSERPKAEALGYLEAKAKAKAKATAKATATTTTKATTTAKATATTKAKEQRQGP
jgi:hypothetical protein